MAAEQSKIAMTLAMAEMEDSARDTGESEIQQACPSSVQGVEDLSADVEALKSQVGSHLVSELCAQKLLRETNKGQYTAAL